MTSPSPEMKPLTIVQRSVLVGIAREVIAALGTADRLQEKPGTLNGERTLAEWCRDILRYEATIRELESRVSQSDAVALKDLFDFIDSVHAPNPETQPRFFQLFEAVRPQVYPFARASRSSGEDQPSSDTETICNVLRDFQQFLTMGVEPDSASWKVIAASDIDYAIDALRQIARGSGEDQTAAAILEDVKNHSAVVIDREKLEATVAEIAALTKRLQESHEERARIEEERTTLGLRCIDLREEIASLKQQVIDSALRAERLEADRTALIEGKVYWRTRDSWAIDGQYSGYPTPDEALAAYRASLSPQPKIRDTCSECGGSGRRSGETCSECGGSGRTSPQPAPPCICGHAKNGDET